MGLLLSGVAVPQHHPSFRAAWRACPPATALKHLDVDAPRLFGGLHEQDASGALQAACLLLPALLRAVACGRRPMMSAAAN